MKHPTLTATLLCLLVGSLARAEQYRVVTEEWPPYNYLDDGQLTGMATSIVRDIMSLTGDDFEIVMLPSMRTAHDLRTRPKTIMYTMFRTTEREPLYKWVGPVLDASIHPYQLATTPRPVNTLQQLLSEPHITTRHAGLVPDMLQSWGFTNLDKSAARSAQLYRMLLAGRATVIIGDTDAGVAFYSEQLGLAPGTLRQIPIEIYHSPLYIAFSRDCEDELIESWSDALEQLRRSGELERIQQQYEHRQSR